MPDPDPRLTLTAGPPLVWPCRWCGHLDWQHNISGLVMGAVPLAPCAADGCRCEDYEEPPDA